MKKIKVGFADDHRLFRIGFSVVLRSFNNIDLIIEAENGEDLLEQMQNKLIPDVVLLDLDMPGLNGIKIAKHLKEQYPSVKSILLTGHDDDDLITRLAQENFCAYLHKDAHEEEVARAIYEVATYGTYTSKRAQEALDQYAEDQSVANIFLEPLTATELEIIKLICKGLKNEEMADLLNKGLRTIENQRLALRKKINAKNTAELINYAIKNKLVDGPDHSGFKNDY